MLQASRSCGRCAASRRTREKRCARPSRSTTGLRDPLLRRQRRRSRPLPLVRGADRPEHAHGPARLLIGDDRISANPKLNNVVKGWRRRATTGSSSPTATSDAARLSPAPARRAGAPNRPRVRAADRLLGRSPCRRRARVRLPQHLSGALAVCRRIPGYGFAQGKTMLWRRERSGKGPAASTLWAPRWPRTRRRPSWCGGQGLTRAPGRRRRSSSRSGRARRCGTSGAAAALGAARRVTFPLFFVPEILTTSLFSLAAAGVAAPAFGVSVALAVAVTAVFWYGAEAALALAAGWPLSWRMPFAWGGCARPHAAGCSPRPGPATTSFGAATP